MAENTCIIEDILKNSFSCRTFVEKSDVIRVGRPVPELPDFRCLHKEKGREYFRYFNTKKYDLTNGMIKLR